MGTLKEFRQRAERLNSERLITEIFRIIRSLEKEFVEKNKEQLYENRTDIFGKAIGFYSAATEDITGGEKKAGDPFNLRDTGNFYDGMYLKIENKVVSIYSTDPKTEMLLTAHENEFSTFLSGEIFGLTDKNLREVIEESILPLFVSAVRSGLLI